MNACSRLMIAAPSSGSGKSVIASGLMAAYSQRFPVQAFKVGPDYIDPMYHTAASGRPSRNLDTWMLSNEQVQRIFARGSDGASLSIIEGVMGLFDGYGSDPLLGSSAAVAALLKTPVILALDCSKMSGSAAAMVHGFNTFSPMVNLAGVICNRVGSQTHARWLREAIEQYNSIPVLGCIPRLEELHVPERRLGLFTVPERPAAVQEFIHQSAQIVTQYVDLERLMAIAITAEPLPTLPEPESTLPEPGIQLAVARDEAFCFYYEDNLDDLRRCGAEIVPFSPLTDERLPQGISGIYFGGGYPELYAGRLSQNSGLRRQVLACCRRNLPVYAECGGLMYLTEGICSAHERSPLVGVLPGWCEMGEKLNMGYREVETIRPGLLAGAGLKLRGHEFHYSRWQPPGQENFVYQVSSRNGIDPASSEGYANGNVQASYIHLHFSQNPQLARNFVDRCRRWQADNEEIRSFDL